MLKHSYRAPLQNLGVILVLGVLKRSLSNHYLVTRLRGFPGGAVVKNPPANAGDTKDMGSIPGLGRCPGV